MNVQTQEMCSEVVRQVARYYSSKCWWLEFEELYQEGWLIAAGCLAKDGLDETRLGGYLRNAVSRSLSRYCWRQSSTVSAAQPSRRLAGLRRSHRLLASIEARDDLEMGLMAMEAAQLVPKLRCALRERLTAIYVSLEKKKATPNPWLSSCLAVLVDGRKPTEVAVEHEIAVRAVYDTTYWMKRSAASDDCVQRILGQIAEQRENLHEYQWDN